MTQDTLQPAVEQTPESPDGQLESQATEQEKQEVVDQAGQQNVEIDSGDDEQEVEGKIEGSWHDSLETDYKSDPNFTKYKSVNDLAKAHRELLKTLGKDKVVVPNDKSTPEEIEAFYRKIGKPETTEDYLTPEVEMPEGVEGSEANIDIYKETAHKLNLTKEQYEGLYKMQSELTKKQFEAEVDKFNKMSEVTESDLRKEWGAAYDTKVEGAQKVVNRYFAGKNIDRAFQVLSKDKGFVKAMSEIAENLGEDAIKGTPRQTKTPAEAGAEYNSIIGNNHEMSKAYFDELNPQHTQALDYVDSLARMMEAS